MHFHWIIIRPIWYYFKLLEASGHSGMIGLIVANTVMAEIGHDPELAKTDLPAT